MFGHLNWSRVLYYRMLGAKIGRGVSIEKGAVLGEYDLLHISDNVQLDRCLCRPFAVEHNTSMYLGRIELGRNSSVGLMATVAPGTTVPENACIGPNSSSWEMKDAREANRDLSSSKIPQPHLLLKIFLATPINIVVMFVSSLPWMAGLVGVASQPPGRSTDMTRSAAEWLTSKPRIGFHFLARILGATLGPLVFILMVILVKKTFDLFFGKMKPSLARNRGQMERFRMFLLESLIPNGDLSRLTDLFGTHYEFTSMVARALGARVGKCVYWPGSGPSVQNFDLLHIGDNVVFGSRSHIVTSDGTGSQYVHIGADAMVADRAVILPGTTIAKRTVLGSESLTRRDTYYAPDTVWVGSIEGGAICLTAADERKLSETSVPQSLGSSQKSSFSESSDSFDGEKVAQADEKKTSSPFGRAFYEGKATYHVLGLFSIFLYSTFVNIFVSVFWNVSNVIAIVVVAKAFESFGDLFGQFWWRPFTVYALCVIVIAAIQSFQAILTLAIIIASKWVLMGRRQPGNYDWDKSSYCQRWQILLTIERLRRKCYGGIGILGLLTGTHYAVLYFRALGASIGKDCALFAGGRPSLLFTEPDLLTLGDRVAVDDASLVGHINTRGNFRLDKLSVGDRSVLRTGSRLLSGATMGKDLAYWNTPSSCLA